MNVFDDDGNPVVGEGVVCTHPFPCMPIMFWNDPDGAKYRGAYFENYDNIWLPGLCRAYTSRRHDYLRSFRRYSSRRYGSARRNLSPGREDAGGSEGLVIGQDWEDDVRVVLARLAEGIILDEGLQKISIGAYGRPASCASQIITVDIPLTKSGKIVELAVRNIVHGQPVKNIEALANPEALKLFENHPELAI